jgi:hypothetical protein
MYDGLQAETRGSAADQAMGFARRVAYRAAKTSLMITVEIVHNATPAFAPRRPLAQVATPPVLGMSRPLLTTSLA